MKNYLEYQSTCLKRGYFSLLIFMMISITGFSQNVGISPGGTIPPNTAAGLDVNFADKGLLLPRVALESTTSSVPMAGHIAGMIVYNTVKTGDVSPGYYFDNGTKWIPFFVKASSSGDMQYWDGTNWVNIPVGIAGQTLQINLAGNPAWGSGVLPIIITKQLSAITSTTATSGGIVLNDAGNSIISYGVCWSTSPAPTIGGTSTSDGAGIGSFSSNLTGLTTATIYYVRAYVTSNSGTTYGNELTFTTP